jgi:hypothetical protein
MVIISTVLVLGLIVGLSTVQSALVYELSDVARAICSLNQSYFFSGFRGCKSYTIGSTYWDLNTCARLCFEGPTGAFGGASDAWGGASFGIGPAPGPARTEARPPVEECPGGCPSADSCPNGECPGPLPVPRLVPPGDAGRPPEAPPASTTPHPRSP